MANTNTTAVTPETTTYPSIFDILNSEAHIPSFLIPEGIYDACYKEIVPSQDPSIVYVQFRVTTKEGREITAGVRVSLKRVQRKDGTIDKDTGLDKFMDSVRSQIGLMEKATVEHTLSLATSIKLINNHYFNKDGIEQNGWSCPSKKALSAANEVADASDILE